jgi:hypothetical protein
VSQALLKWRKTAQETLEVDDPPFLSRDKGLKELWTELGLEVEEEVTSKSPRYWPPQ